VLPAGTAQAQAQSASQVRRTPVVVAVERAAPATVNITTTQEVHRSVNPFFRSDPLFKEFFGMFLDPRPQQVQSLGTGVIIDDEGHVLTNEHVLAGSTHIRVTLSDAREFDAELIGADPETDLAVVRIADRDAHDLPIAPLGRSDDLMIGETVVAIGNPFGLHHTVTTGVLSATNRSIVSDDREYHGFLQTDASINPGNSGGPLLNLDGEVIGINTAIFREAEGIGFAIPTERAQRIVDDLIRHGEVAPVWLGLRLQDLTPPLRSALRVNAARGAVIGHVFEGSPAERAGIAHGDVVVELDGSRVQSTRAFYEILGGITDSDAVRLGIERDGKRSEREVRAELFPEGRVDELARVLLGMVVEPITGRLHGGKAVGGMRIAEVAAGGISARLGLRPGDVILEMDRERVADSDAFRRAVTRLRGRSHVLLLVHRGGRGYHLTLRLS
jgi:serine protease Do